MSNVSRQRKRQLANVREGRCAYCTRPLFTKSRCAECAAIHRTKQLARSEREAAERADELVAKLEASIERARGCERKNALPR